MHTFQNWYHKAMHAVRGPMDDAAPEDATSGAEDQETDEEAAPELDDYTARLQMMVLLYRRRSDSDCDAGLRPAAAGTVRGGVTDAGRIMGL